MVIFMTSYYGKPKLESWWRILMDELNPSAGEIWVSFKFPTSSLPDFGEMAEQMIEQLRSQFPDESAAPSLRIYMDLNDAVARIRLEYDFDGVIVVGEWQDVGKGSVPPVSVLLNSVLHERHKRN